MGSREKALDGEEETSVNNKFTLQYTCSIASEVAICMGGLKVYQ